MAAFGSAGFTLTGAGEPERVDGAAVSAAYFNVLGIRPELGRGFLTRDQESGEATVILSHELWQRRFGGDASVLGRTLLLDGQSHSVIGVVPPGIYPSWPTAGRFSFRPSSQQFFVPLRFDARRAANRNSHVFGVIGRLHEGITHETAQNSMNDVAARLAALYPATNEGEGIVLTPLESEVAGDVRPALLLLLAAVGLVLVLSCANVASVLLARAASREREIAVRRALGASRARIALLMLTESSVLALLGGVAGCALAAVGVNALVSVLPVDLPRLADIAVNGRVMSFALMASLLTSLAFGLGPALHASASDPALGLRGGSGTADRQRQRVRRSLVVFQVALALILLTGGALLARSFEQLRRVDPGFKPDGLLVFDLDLSSRYASLSQIVSAYSELQERLRGLPAAQTVTLAYDSPIESNWIDVFGIEGRPAPERELSARLAIVGPGYFEALGIAIRAGRPIEDRDSAGAPGAVVVSETFAKRFFPRENPLGNWMTLSGPSYTWGEEAPSRFQIVGVANDVRSLGIAVPPEPTYYVSANQFPLRDMSVLVKTTGEPLTIVGSVRAEVARFDDSLAMANVTTLPLAISANVAQPRFNMLVLVGFAVLALSLAAVGLYGLVAYSVSRRTREIGVRLALGARPEQVTRLVVGEGLALVALGGCLGLIGSLLGGRLIASLLFGVEPGDMTSFALGAFTLFIASLIAAYVPARRAARVAPASALRTE
jgi:predicted permease